MPEFKSLKKPLLSQEVEKYLRQSLTRRVYKPGNKLPSERELVDQFKVSRVTIREALRNLQTCGLITVKRGINAGVYVSELNSDPITENFKNLVRFGKTNFVHLLDARLYIEPQAACIAASCRTNEDIEILTELLDTAERTVEMSCKESRLINVRFHCEVAKVTKNPIIIFITESVTQVYSAELIEITGETIGKKTTLSHIKKHRYILDSIADKNMREAFERTRRHISEIYHFYRRIIPNVSEKDIKAFENHIRLLADRKG
jgi:GntR family transcriptional repressor for pyruvate dehydrogenase complex